jgi:hypothetical protein
MMEQCYRCNGMIGQQYDAILRTWEPYCLNCGARPQHRPKFADGRDVKDGLLCGKCKVNRRSVILAYHGGSQEIEWCVACRTEDLEKRRLIDMKRRNRMGNVRHKGVLLQ